MGMCFTPPESAGASHTQPPCGLEKWFTKKVSPPTSLRTKAMKIALSLPKKPALRPALSLTSMPRFDERATIEPASAMSVSPGASCTWSKEKVGSCFTMCCGMLFLGCFPAFYGEKLSCAPPAPGPARWYNASVAQSTLTSPGGGKPAGFGQSWKRTAAEIGVLLVAAVAVFVALRGCLGCIAEKAVAHMPPSVDEKIGKAAAEEFRAKYKLSGDPSAEQKARAERLFAELYAGLDAEEKKIVSDPSVTVVVDPTVNAFCL